MNYPVAPNENNESIVHCPTCQKKDTWKTDNPFRPFCGERCHLIDLGKWASGEYAIKTNEFVSDELSDLSGSDETLK